MNEQEKYDWMVYVSCMTFNHAPYMVDAMNGFTMQETNFPFVCAIVDDASTDGEQKVIKSYLNKHFDLEDNNVVRHEETDDYVLTFARHKTNKNCYFAVLYLKYNHYSIKKTKVPYIAQWREKAKYIALCEGDDYWINPLKLQKQVDFLDRNTLYTVCSHRIMKYDQDSGVYYADRLEMMFKDKEGCEFDNKTRVWISETSSIVYRHTADKEYMMFPYEKRDTIHMYYLLKYGRGFCFSEKMSVYRQHQGGVFSKQGLDAKLLQGSYKAMKDLHSWEKTEESRFLYYRCYALTFLLTRGRILFKERFDLKKFLTLPYYIFTILIGVHPVYERID